MHSWNLAKPRFLCDLHLPRVVFIQQKVKDMEYLLIETTTLNEAIMHTMITTARDPDLAIGKAACIVIISSVIQNNPYRPQTPLVVYCCRYDFHASLPP